MVIMKDEIVSCWIIAMEKRDLLVEDVLEHLRMLIILNEILINNQNYNEHSYL